MVGAPKSEGTGDPGVEAELRQVKAVVGVVEGLVEDTDTGEELVGEVVRDGPVMDGGEVLGDVRSDLVVVEDVGSNSGELAPGSDEGADGEALPRCDGPVDLSDGVIAVPALRSIVEEVTGGSGTGRLVALRQRARTFRESGLTGMPCDLRSVDAAFT